MLVPTAVVTLPSGSRSVATNSISGATPTVPNSRRVVELKNVLVNSASGSASDQRRELVADLRPQLPLERVFAQLQAQLGNGLADEPIVQLDTLDRIALTAFPVAGIEAPGRAPGDDTELGVVIRECCNDEVSAVGARHGFELLLSRIRWAGPGSNDARTVARSGLASRAR